MSEYAQEIKPIPYDPMFDPHVTSDQISPDELQFINQVAGMFNSEVVRANKATTFEQGSTGLENPSLNPQKIIGELVSKVRGYQNPQPQQRPSQHPQYPNLPNPNVTIGKNQTPPPPPRPAEDPNQLKFGFLEECDNEKVKQQQASNVNPRDIETIKNKLENVLREINGLKTIVNDLSPKLERILQFMNPIGYDELPDEDFKH